MSRHVLCPCYRLHVQRRREGQRLGVDGPGRPVHGDVVQGGRGHGDPNAVHHTLSTAAPAEAGHLLSNVSRWATTTYTIQSVVTSLRVNLHVKLSPDDSFSEGFRSLSPLVYGPCRSRHRSPDAVTRPADVRLSRTRDRKVTTVFVITRSQK